MKPERLLLMLAALMLNCGCAGRMDSDLLQARIREQSIQLTESQREIAKTRADLKRARVESEQLKLELEQAGHQIGERTPVSQTVTQLRIHSLSSGGLNKDDQPGDDAVVFQFVPLNSDNEIVRAPGELEVALLDPQMPEPEQKLGTWNFTSDECQKKWTRGITSSGYQFSLPLDPAPRHSELIVHLKYRTSDDRHLQIRHVVKIVIPPVVAQTQTRSVPKRRRIPDPLPAVDESDDFLPPAGDAMEGLNQTGEADWASDNSETVRVKTETPILHSSSWTDETIPYLR